MRPPKQTGYSGWARGAATGRHRTRRAGLAVPAMLLRGAEIFSITDAMGEQCGQQELPALRRYPGVSSATAPWSGASRYRGELASDTAAAAS